MITSVLQAEIIIASLQNEVQKGVAEIADLKQQLHAYREYHDARDAYDRETATGRLPYINGPEDMRVRKANEELQLLRNRK